MYIHGLTHSEEIINLSSDERPHESQVFLKLSSAYRIEEVFIPVGSKHHLLILRQELPHPATHLSKGVNIQLKINIQDVVMYWKLGGGGIVQHLTVQR